MNLVLVSSLFDYSCQTHLPAAALLTEKVWVGGHCRFESKCRCRKMDQKCNFVLLFKELFCS